MLSDVCPGPVNVLKLVFSAHRLPTPHFSCFCVLLVCQHCFMSTTETEPTTTTAEVMNCWLYPTNLPPIFDRTRPADGYKRSATLLARLWMQH